MNLHALLRQAIENAHSPESVGELTNTHLQDAIRQSDQDVFGTVVSFLLAVNETQDMAVRAQDMDEGERTSAENATEPPEPKFRRSDGTQVSFEEALESAKQLGKELAENPIVLMIDARYGELKDNFSPYLIPLVAYFGSTDPAVVIREEFARLFPDDPTTSDEPSGTEPADWDAEDLTSFLEGGPNRGLVERVVTTARDLLSSEEQRFLDFVYRRPQPDYRVTPEDYAWLISVITGKSNWLMEKALVYEIGNWNDHAFVGQFVDRLMQLPIASGPHNPGGASVTWELLELIEVHAARATGEYYEAWQGHGERFVPWYNAEITKARRGKGPRSPAGYSLGARWRQLDCLIDIAQAEALEFCQDYGEDAWRPDVLVLLTNFSGSIIRFERSSGAFFFHDLSPQSFAKFANEFERFQETSELDADSEDTDDDNDEDSNEDDEKVYLPPKLDSATVTKRVWEYILDNLDVEHHERLSAALIAFWLFAISYRTRGRLCGDGPDSDFSFILPMLRRGLGGRHREIIIKSLRATIRHAKEIECDDLVEKLRPYLPSEEDDLKLLIAKGESLTLEFKQTLRWDVRQDKREGSDKRISSEWVKTICAFLNTNGGTLLIGVTDSGRVVGLDYKKDGIRSDDKLLLLIKDTITSAIDNWVTSYVDSRIVHTQEGRVLRVDVKPSPKEAFANIGEFKDDFLVRQGPSSKKLTPREMVAYQEARRQTGVQTDTDDVQTNFEAGRFGSPSN